jgi:glycosyltransferase 2 family protein
MTKLRIPGWLGHVLKVGVAVALLVFMLRSGKLRPEVIASAAHQWPSLLVVVALTITLIWITSVRWRLLLLGQGCRLGLRQTFSLTLIGTLFSTVIPGAVSGDLVKAWYVGRDLTGQRTRVLATILMDRLIGLACLAAVASVGVLSNFRLVFASRTLGTLGLLALGGCVAGLLGLVVAATASEPLLALVRKLPERLPLRALLLRLAEVLASYHGQGGRLAAAFALSVPVHLMGCLSMLICLHAVGGRNSMPAELVLFAFPLGMLAISVPITPAGIGVGQAAFFAVCDMALSGSGPAGANAFTVFQAVVLPVYVLGLFPYLAYRKSLGPAHPETAQAQGAADGGEMAIE